MIAINSKIIKNFFYNSSYQLLLFFLPLITTPYVSRILGANGIGVYSYYYSIASYFALFILLGLNNYGNRTIAYTLNKDECSKTFCNIYCFQFIMGVLVCCLYIIYSLFISENKYITYIFLIYIISGILDINWFFAGIQQFKVSVVRNIIVKVLGTICIFVFVNDSEDIDIYCIIMALSALFSQILLWPFLYKQIKFIKPQFAEIKKHIKPNLALFMTVLAVSLYKIMDKIMLGMMANYNEVGYYESSEKIINIPLAFVVSLGTVMLPYTTRLISKGVTDNKKLIHISLIFSMILTSALSFGVMSVADIFVPIFYGKGYDKCIYLYYILMPSCLFLAFANVVRTQYLLPNKLDKEYIKSAFLGAGINFLINIILIPKIASIGAAVGTLLAEAFVCVYQCYVCRNGFNCMKILKQITPFVASGILMFSILFNLNINIDNTLLLLATKILSGICIYTLALILIWKKLNHLYTDYIK